MAEMTRRPEAEQEDPCASALPRTTAGSVPTMKRAQIIYEAARHEFAASGYAATSMETVARRAGVSTKTLYRLIPNKAALFEGHDHQPYRYLCVGSPRAGVRRQQHQGRLARCAVVWGELILDE